MRVLFAVLVLCLSFPAMAQEKESIYDLIPDEFLIEAKNYVTECEGNSQMNLYYNCECMGSSYLDERIQRGPDAPVSGIRLAVVAKPDCKDASGIAAQHYQNCFNMPINLPPDTTPEAYCECYANEFAKEFERYGGTFGSKQNVVMMTRARITCGSPDLRKRFNM